VDVPEMSVTTVSGGNRRGGYPALDPLATPAGPPPGEAGAVVATVNPLTADAFALYVKTKNNHWHLAGPHFRDYHLLFDDHADAILESVDPLAERVRKLGETSIRSIGQVAALTRIADDDGDYVPADEMLRRLIADNRLIAARRRAAIAVCDVNRDPVTSNLLQEVLDGTERQIWFLFEASREDEQVACPG
jgi:starvation-inducible DNA-binding protein